MKAYFGDSDPSWRVLDCPNARLASNFGYLPFGAVNPSHAWYWAVQPSTKIGYFITASHYGNHVDGIIQLHQNPWGATRLGKDGPNAMLMADFSITANAANCVPSSHTFQRLKRANAVYVDGSVTPGGSSNPVDYNGVGKAWHGIGAGYMVPNNRIKQ